MHTLINRHSENEFSVQAVLKWNMQQTTLNVSLRNQGSV